MRPAVLQDLPLLIELMRGYYRDDGLAFDPDRARATVSRLLSEPQWGRVYLIQADGVTIGYVAICIGYSIEFGGNEAFIDEVFVVPEHRQRGHARRALAFVTREARSWGVRALHLEVDKDNHAAQRLYADLGYSKRERYYLMTAHLEESS